MRTYFFFFFNHHQSRFALQTVRAPRTLRILALRACDALVAIEATTIAEAILWSIDCSTSRFEYPSVVDARPVPSGSAKSTCAVNFGRLFARCFLCRLLQFLLQFILLQFLLQFINCPSQLLFVLELDRLNTAWCFCVDRKNLPRLRRE